jgi:hypothetical protein
LYDLEWKTKPATVWKPDWTTKMDEEDCDAMNMIPNKPISMDPVF